PEHQGHQRVAARSQLRVRPERVRPPHARVLRVRGRSEGLMPQSYLVQYGKSGFVGRFRPADTEPHARGHRVVVRSRRGLELGTVLCEPATRFDAPDDGDLVRRATDGDAESSESRGADLLAAAQTRADELGLPLAVVDVEILLDCSAVLHALPWAE